MTPAPSVELVVMEDWPQGDRGSGKAWVLPAPVLDSGSWAAADPGQWIGFMKANGS